MEFFISGMQNKRFHIILASIFFAIATWISVNLRDEYTIVRHLPVVIENMKEGKALRYPLPKFVSVRFHGTGWSLAGLYFSPDVKYFIDVSNIGSGDFIITGRDLLEHTKLPVSLQPIDVKPDTMVLALDEYREKRVPIVPRILLDYKDGYGQVGPVRVNPESTVVGGSLNLLRTIAVWYTEYRKFENLHAPISTDIPLEDPPNYSVEIFNQTAHLQVNIQPFAEKTFAGIPIIATGVPPGRDVIFIPPKMDIIVRGGIDQLAKLNPQDFSATVSYQALLQDSTGNIAPAMASPEEVKIVSQKPERFQFIIRKKL